MAGEANIEKIVPPGSSQELPKVETGPTPEKDPETFFNEKKEKSAQAEIVAKIKNPSVLPTTSTSDWERKRAQEIDEILSAGLSEIFLKMPPKEQASFKKTGEETVKKINNLLSETKVKVNKIIDLIRRWLKIIPGVNKFFLEQEAKIKADKIINLKNKF